MQVIMKDYESLKEAVELCFGLNWEIFGCEESSVRDFLRREEKYSDKLPGLPYSKNNMSFDNIWDKCDKLASLFLKEGKVSDIVFLGNLETIMNVYSEKLYLVKRGTVVGDFAKLVKFKRYEEKDFNIQSKNAGKKKNVEFDLESFEVPDITITLNENLDFQKYMKAVAVSKGNMAATMFRMKEQSDIKIIEDIYEGNDLNLISFMLNSKHQNSQPVYVLNELIIRNAEKGVVNLAKLDKKSSLSFFQVFLTAIKLTKSVTEREIIELAKKLPEEYHEEVKLLHPCLNRDEVKSVLLVDAFKNSNLDLKIDFKQVETVINIILSQQIKNHAETIASLILENYGYECLEFHEIKGNVFLESKKKVETKTDLTKDVFLEAFAKACAYLLNSEYRFNNSDEMVNKVINAWIDERAMRKDLESHEVVSVSSHKIKKF